MPSQTINVFVSYSHADAPLVAPVVSLLRVNKSLVFQDTDRIPPGKRWRDEIAKALAESNLVVVFWCHHASRSNEVSTEWRAAIEQDKDLLPLLLDATPLPSELGNFQWIDFRGTVGANHSASDSPAGAARTVPMTASPRRAVRYTLGGVVAAAALFLSILLTLRAPSQAPPFPLPEPSLPEASAVALIPWILVSLGAVGALGAYLLWLRRRSTKRAKPIETGTPYPGNIERQIAVELEAEILRRTR
jgi:TIR domain